MKLEWYIGPDHITVSEATIRNFYSGLKFYFKCVLMTGLIICQYLFLKLTWKHMKNHWTSGERRGTCQEYVNVNL